MGRSMQEPAAAAHRDHRSHFFYLQHLYAHTLTSKSSLRSRISLCLHRALLSCRGIVVYVRSFLFHHVVLVLLFGCLMLKLMASHCLLHFLLNSIRAFLLRKLYEALRFALLAVTIGLLGFFLGEDPAARSILKAMRGNEAKGKKADFNERERVSLDSIGTWLFGTADEFFVENQSVGPCESLKDEYVEKDGGQPLSAAALDEQQEKEYTACTNDTKCSSEVRSLPAEANSNSEHDDMRSRSFSFAGLNLHKAVDLEAEPSIGHRSASFSFAGDSNMQPWMQDTYAELLSPPLPPFAFDMLGKGDSFSSESGALGALQTKLAPWRSPRKSFNSDKAGEAQLKKVLDGGRCGDVLRRRRRSKRREELQQRSEAFIAQQLQQWRLGTRNQKVIDQSRSEA